VITFAQDLPKDGLGRNSSISPAGWMFRSNVQLALSTCSW